MKLELGRKVIVYVLVCSTVLLPAQQMLAAGPYAGADKTASTQTVVRDVALQPGGVIQGQVVDAQGIPCPDVVVQITKVGTNQEVVAVGRTDGQGRFQFAGMSGGVHWVQTPEGGMICRLWAANTAPPAAVPAVMVVQGQGPVRGNLGGITPLGWTLIGLGVAAAIAIPLALQQHHHHAS